MKSKKQDRFTALKWILSNAKNNVIFIVLIVIVTMLISGSSIKMALCSRDIVDVATGEVEGSVIIQGLIIIGIVVLQLVLSSVNSLLCTVTNGRLIIGIRKRVFSAILKCKYSKISEYHSGELINRLTSDVDVVISAITNMIPTVFSFLTRVIAGAWALFVLDGRLAIIVISVGFLFPAIARLFSKKYKEMHKRCQESEGKVRAFMQECFENIVVLKTFVSETPIVKRLGELLRKNFNEKIKRSYLSIVANFGISGFFSVGYYIVMVWGATQISSGKISYGTLIAFLELVSNLMYPLQGMSGLIPQYLSAIASAERIIAVENMEHDLEGITGGELDELKNNFRYLEGKNIKFSYDDSEQVLENCNFLAEKGKITAITGESGSGKSTIFKLILGLFEPEEGSIMLNGEIHLDTSMRGLFAYVPQGNLLLSGTIRDNITLCDYRIDDEKVISAAKAAEIYDYIATLPEGFDTVLAERGAGLSEGQIQRISIARALLTDAPVLLLDEATSALDEATETKVLDNIKSLTDKTIVFVTHRNTSLKVCDKIIHVENKQFVIVKE